jgi:predicted DNA-binding transcriptional regulator YafY
MPVDKNTIFRYKILDSLFRTGDFNTGQILEIVNKKLSSKQKLSVSKRTIQNDLKEMNELAKDIIEIDYNIIETKYFGSIPHYGYEDKNDSLFKLSISNEQIKNINKAYETLIAQNSKSKVALNLKRTLLNIQQTYDLNEYNSFSKVIFDEEPEYAGKEHLSILLNKIIEQTAITFEYKEFEAQPKTIQLHPYFLRQFNNRWYIFGAITDLEIKRFALDRVSAIKNSKAEFIVSKNDILFYENRFRDLIGVSESTNENANKELIMFKVEVVRANYIDTKKIHHSQKKISETKTHKTFSIEVIPNKELDALFLQFGMDIEIISPKHIREKMKTILEKAVKNYQ